jgi:hypothetical protein
MVTPSRSFQSFARSQEPGAAGLAIPSNSNSLMNRMSLSPLDTLTPAANASSTTPMAGVQTTASAPNTPTGKLGSSPTSQYPRPSTLHGLKHKLHSSPCSNVKSLHAPTANSVPNRRKSVGHIPLSPLARSCGEKSPSPLPASSPTRSDGGRSPSPLAWPVVHQPGSSNTTQSYSPSSSGSLSNIGSLTSGGVGVLTAVANVVAKKGFARPKSADPSSPLLRRALSPDRGLNHLHPRDANKCTISPLCCSGPVKNQRPVSGVWRSPNMSSTIPASCVDQMTLFSSNLNSSFSGTIDKISEDCEPPPAKPTTLEKQSNCMPFQEMLPRIAEEKDSPSTTLSGDLHDDADRTGLDKTLPSKQLKHKHHIVTSKPPAPPVVQHGDTQSEAKPRFFSTVSSHRKGDSEHAGKLSKAQKTSESVAEHSKTEKAGKNN